MSVRRPLRYHPGTYEISSLPFVIGVAGGSGSGKSTVTQQVLASFGADMVSVAIEMPEYDFTIDNRSSKTIPVKPAAVIVIEGLFALYDADLCNMMSLKIFVDANGPAVDVITTKVASVIGQLKRP